MILHVSHLILEGTPGKPGETGTAMPSTWHHRILIRGVWHQAILKSDLIHHVPTLHELLIHCGRNPDLWIPMIPTNAPTH